MNHAQVIKSFEAEASIFGDLWSDFCITDTAYSTEQYTENYTVYSRQQTVCVLYCYGCGWGTHCENLAQYPQKLVILSLWYTYDDKVYASRDVIKNQKKRKYAKTDNMISREK
jgi:hypothetical protein